ncbi:DNA polymerase III subunit gamma/tau [Sandarakinorhabdus cyanobacteriorum]|uniref:DNA polymerase III subunit gamma/tau n=1 Tax=Sandarakinorhabdus cyanobacteriorum TaxID=1981098 RepID=A0A255Y644_9SPHN|nr:DNA polymerase III subunit gamma/tau [Sandarakinorhabdus cyanobacteriorum]OYQ24699.1 DNA polymerase III subunit gamma/tau [Sandarakinorhabdus cyanobacteriorum]
MSDESDIAFPGLDLPATATAPAAYRVLARKYRPASFDALLGQDAMVQTLGNAIARGRLAQAWLLTGVRGVGKTSTARIIAKALNCIGPDGQGGPTISPCGQCEPCTAIAAGRHIDVVEMDAASNTGVDDVREIIEGVRYAAVSARYKIHIIDEVHMLSKAAFNALLKTLEEPPPGVKFIMATTEVNKVPATILSRCQRFDLKRIPADMLAGHFARILDAEGVAAEADALALIARAAEGSVRDGLSILDQAIAHSGETITAAAVRDMLGLADRSAVRDLFGQVLAGDVPGLMAAIARQYDLGQDPAQLLRELLDLVHGITRQRMAPRHDPALSAEEQAALDNWAKALGFPRLSLLWQMLLKGLEEVNQAPVPLQAAEMALLRLCHAADLPDPGSLIRQLQQDRSPEAGARAPAPGPATTSAPVAATAGPAAATLPADFATLVALFRQRGEARLAHYLHDEIRLIACTPPSLSLAATGLPGDVKAAIATCLAGWTGTKWHVEWHADGGGPTLREIEIAEGKALIEKMKSDPVVAALKAAFPDAEDPVPLARSA